MKIITPDRSEMSGKYALLILDMSEQPGIRQTIPENY